MTKFSSLIAGNNLSSNTWLNLIKFLQIKTFAKSDGVIFLHQYAKNIIDKNMNKRVSYSGINWDVENFLMDVITLTNE